MAKREGNAVRFNSSQLLTGLFCLQARQDAAVHLINSVQDLDTDWRDWWEERAAILEYEAGLPREQAEADALAETIRQMELRAQQGRS